MTTPTRRLIVLRHAESEPEDGRGDRARPLHERGRRDAARVGERLRALGWVPQAVVSSDATRTRQTWACMQPALGVAPPVAMLPALYLMGPDELRAALRGVGPAVGTVMAIGHNPGWEDAVHELCGVRVRMGPCMAALLEGQAEGWSTAVDGVRFALVDLVRPPPR